MDTLTQQTPVVLPEQVRAMRDRYAAGGVTMADLVDEFGLPIGAAFEALTGQPAARDTWR